MTEDSTELSSRIEKLWQRQSNLDNHLFKLQYEFKVLSYDVCNKMTDDITQRARSAAVEWVSNYTHEIIEEHVNDSHYYLNCRLVDMNRKLSEYNDFYSKVADLQSALEKASERIAALERIVIGGYD